MKRFFFVYDRKKDKVLWISEEQVKLITAFSFYEKYYLVLDPQYLSKKA
jgi:hypothetical protein